MSYYADSTAQHPAYSYIRSNINYIRDLPQPGDRWHTGQVSEGVRNQIRQLYQQGCVTQGERVGKRDNRYWYYSDRRAYDSIQHVLDTRPTGPCGHTGISTLEAGERYTCGYEFCDVVFGRDVAEGLV